MAHWTIREDSSHWRGFCFFEGDIECHPESHRQLEPLELELILFDLEEMACKKKGINNWQTLDSDEGEIATIKYQNGTTIVCVEDPPRGEVTSGDSEKLAELIRLGRL